MDGFKKNDDRDEKEPDSVVQCFLLAHIKWLIQTKLTWEFILFPVWPFELLVALAEDDFSVLGSLVFMKSSESQIS